MNDYDLHFNRVLEYVERLKQSADGWPERDTVLLEASLNKLSAALQELQQHNGRLYTQYEDLIAAFRALETKRWRYQALFELAPNGYLVTDTGTVIQEANAAATNLLHTPRDLLVGKSLTMFVAERDRQGFELWLAGSQMGNELQERELHIQPGKGVPFPASLTVATISDTEGQIVGLRWLLRDISERKQNEQERARLAAIVQSSSDAIISRTLEGAVESWNSGAERLYGYSVDEIKGRPISDLFLPARAEEETANLVKINQGESIIRYETTRLGKDGQQIYVSLTASPIKDTSGRIIGASEIARDISERKRMQIAEQEQHVLAEALRDTATALNSTLDLSEVLDRILANVWRVMPHDAAEIMLIESGIARVVRSRGYGELGLRDAVMALRLPVDDTPNLRQMVETGQPLIIPDTHTYPGWMKFVQEEWLRSYAGAPIYFQGEIKGFINLLSGVPGFFTLIHAERLQAFAEQAAIAIHNAQLYEQAQELAALQERQRLARDLHDVVSQTLFSSSIIAEALPRVWKRDPEKMWPYLIQLHRLNQGALAEMRNLLLELRPTKLLEVEINDLLRQLVQAIMGRTRIAVSLTIEGKHSLPPDVRVAFYRIAQEALNNTVKHARATQIAVYLDARPERAELRLKDNGSGFNLRQIPSTRMGLSIMQERAKAIGASLQIISEIGQGTELVVLWPDQKGRITHHDEAKSDSRNDR